jgi:hypothetical protein
MIALAAQKVKKGGTYGALLFIINTTINSRLLQSGDSSIWYFTLLHFGQLLKKAAPMVR